MCEHKWLFKLHPGPDAVLGSRCGQVWGPMGEYSENLLESLGTQQFVLFSLDSSICNIHCRQLKCVNTSDFLCTPSATRVHIVFALSVGMLVKQNFNLCHNFCAFQPKALKLCKWLHCITTFLIMQNMSDILTLTFGLKSSHWQKFNFAITF